MQLQEYIDKSARTEKALDNLVVFGERNAIIKALFNRAIVAAEALDKIKKSVIYGKYIDMEEFRNQYQLNDKALGKKEQITLPEERARVLHHLLGIVGEAGELAEKLLPFIENGGYLDTMSIVEEMGDLHWYLAGMHRALNITADEVLEKNYGKLEIRYPEAGYTDTHAINRDYENERSAFEGD